MSTKRLASCMIWNSSHAHRRTARNRGEIKTIKNMLGSSKGLMRPFSLLFSPQVLQFSSYDDASRYPDGGTHAVVRHKLVSKAEVWIPNFRLCEYIQYHTCDLISV
ncbi:hypothetical protein ACMFMF_009371 [Clarireedia jacksonii]